MNLGVQGRGFRLHGCEASMFLVHPDIFVNYMRAGGGAGAARSFEAALCAHAHALRAGRIFAFLEFLVYTIRGSILTSAAPPALQSRVCVRTMLPAAVIFVPLSEVSVQLCCMANLRVHSTT